ncbi:MAG: Gfo/Idh/MocA family oxidoreductase [Anaerolineae bacterium]|nr:Gfo/Idh/MocA family oxidoreductase [Anaerolineae bacterium]
MVSGKDETATFGRKLKMGMVGGGRDAFIGAVHRRAAMLDGAVELVAGAFSSTPEKSKLSARDFYVSEDRAYGTYQEMIEKERALPEGERIDFVSIVTPNHMHYPIAKAFVDAGFNVVLDKPMVHSSEQANSLIAAVEEQDAVFAVTYNYTAYPLVKQARQMVREGKLGEIRKVIVEYPQDWLRTKEEDTGQKQASWRTDPSRSGIAGSVGDIGSHAENLVSTITGLEIAEICADLTTFVPGRLLDDDANVLMHFTNGARGILSVSQVCTGQENNHKIRIWGTEGALEWIQEQPNYLTYWHAGDPVQVMARGHDYLCEAAKRATRLPTGHPEAFIEAFGNVYLNATDTIRAKIMGVEATELERDYPTVYDGARGVYFIEKVVESSKSNVKWLPFQWTPGK